MFSLIIYLSCDDDVYLTICYLYDTGQDCRGMRRETYDNPQVAGRLSTVLEVTVSNTFFLFLCLSYILFHEIGYYEQATLCRQFGKEHFSNVINELLTQLGAFCSK